MQPEDIIRLWHYEHEAYQRRKGLKLALVLSLAFWGVALLAWWKV